jgi:hypothetical protein
MRRFFVCIRLDWGFWFIKERVGGKTIALCSVELSVVLKKCNDLRKLGLWAE